MKYIVTKDNALIIFDEFVEHKDMAERCGVEAKSAGFTRMDRKRKLGVYGDSFSLRLKPGPLDQKMINKKFGAIE